MFKNKILRRRRNNDKLQLTSQKSIPQYRLVVLGIGGVGKSALIVQFVQGHFLVDYDPTIEDSYVKQYCVDGALCKIDLIDTAGQEEFGAMREQYLRCGDGFALTYSVFDKASFEYIPQIYKQILRVKDRDEYPMILLANKIDLNLQNRRVSPSDGENLGRMYNMPYFEVSAKNRLNIDESFSELIRSIRRFNSSEKNIKYNDERRKTCVLL